MLIRELYLEKKGHIELNKYVDYKQVHGPSGDFPVWDASLLLIGGADQPGVLA